MRNNQPFSLSFIPAFLLLLGVLLTPLIRAQEGSGEIINDPPKDFNKGSECWVLIFDGENFRGRSLGIVGEVKMKKMIVDGIDWSGEFDSAMVGKRARVKYYSEQKFKGRELVLLPGAQMENVNRIRFGNQMFSLKTECVAD